MNFPTEIICHIDNSIKGALDKQVKLLGLAKLITKVEKDKKSTFPAVFNEQLNEYSEACIDDMFPAIVYHRSINATLLRLQRGGYGDQLPNMRFLQNMSMVIFVRNTDNSNNAESIAMKISMAFPSSLLPIQKEIKSVTTTVNNIVLNAQQVFDEEYKNVAFFLSPEHILLKVNYTIEGVCKSSCSNTCQ